ncbi:MAG: hypothetical protein A2Y56_14745 [Candidatus Aminicenantes bacterium RBG_13_63_10]|nr:MAG: hypothetical protein A2Y56_14745 [Candidatus Aminicenantes bacterium RBG_13_63_10]
MKKMMKLMALAAAVALVFSACGSKPTQIIDEAKAQIEALAKDAADKYAPEEFKKLNDNLTAALDEVKGQEGKLFKKFGKSVEILNQVKADAEALKAALPGKIEAAKTAALDLQTAAGTAIKEAEELLKKAPRGKGSKADIEAFKADLKGLNESLPQVQAALDAQDYIGAADQAKAIQEKAMSIVDQINQAIAKVKGK